jgi:phosphoesterase RecJ-like protein
MDLSARREILPLIRAARRILIIAHVDPDGDAIGSLLALGHALRSLGKRVVLASADPVPAEYRFLPGSEVVTAYPAGEFQILISVDCSDIQRMGTAYRPAAFAHRPLINIDHHATNVNFGSVNWVDSTAASTAEMVFSLIEEMAVPITSDIALCLLTGVVTDTRCFRTSSTTARTMATATRLMEAGASLPVITEQVLNRRPLAAIRLWAEALTSIQLRNRVIWTEITQAMLERSGVQGNGVLGGLSNFLVSAHEADVAVVFTEKRGGSVEVGFRSVPGIDVSRVAFQLGGGGHPQASGCTIQGTMEEARERVLTSLNLSLSTQRGARQL